jgi:hypothetical protein
MVDVFPVVAPGETVTAVPLTVKPGAMLTLTEMLAVEAL